MTKAELVEKVHEGADGALSKRQASELVDVVFSEVGRAVQEGGRFSYPGFGTFTVKKRNARVGRNPQTGQQIKIAPTKTVAFKPSPEFKKSL